jgi:DNA-directed RNA polymerase subunit RPC12/RpoP
MRCSKCGERVLKKGRLPGEGLVIINRYVLFQKGADGKASLIAACARCGTHVNLMKSPTLIKVSPKK